MDQLIINILPIRTPNRKRFSLIPDVFFSERDVLDQHGRLGAEEDPQHRLKESTAEGLNMRLNMRPRDCFLLFSVSRGQK